MNCGITVHVYATTLPRRPREHIPHMRRRGPSPAAARQRVAPRVVEGVNTHRPIDVSDPVKRLFSRAYLRD